jgi:hypothetical protein
LEATVDGIGEGTSAAVDDATAALGLVTMGVAIETAAAA